MWKATAPANIALIKYMGKTPGNRPTNASLSYSLEHLRTEVRLSECDGASDVWRPLQKDGYHVHLSAVGEQRFLKFFDLLKRGLGLKKKYLIESGNSFPSDCGLASSASSFAALTKAAAQAAGSAGLPPRTALELSCLSRQGSGSSCRSFFHPWALWQGEGAEPMELPYTNLHHQVAVVAAGGKAVSSSEAHVRVTGSSLFEGRAGRAESRLGDLIRAMRAQDWRRACEVAWQEFWDMHALFETSAKPFGYMDGRSLDVLRLTENVWRDQGDGPMVTMDAGPNVHLLYRADQSALAARLRLAMTEIGILVMGNDVTTV